MDICDVCGCVTPKGACSECAAPSEVMHEFTKEFIEFGLEDAKLRYNISRRHRRYFNTMASKFWPKAMTAVANAMPLGAMVKKRSLVVGDQRRGFVRAKLDDMEIRARIIQYLKINPTANDPAKKYFPAISVSFDLYLRHNGNKTSMIRNIVTVDIQSENEVTELEWLRPQLANALRTFGQRNGK